MNERDCIDEGESHAEAARQGRAHLLQHNRVALLGMVADAVADGRNPHDLCGVIADARDPMARPLWESYGSDVPEVGLHDTPTLVTVLPRAALAAFTADTHPNCTVALLLPAPEGKLYVLVIGSGGVSLTMVTLKQRVLNVFLFVERGVIVTIGARAHELFGTERELLVELKKRVEADVREPTMFQLPENVGMHIRATGQTIRRKMLYSTYVERGGHLGCNIGMYEEAFRHFGMPESPMVLETVVEDGQLRA